MVLKKDFLRKKRKGGKLDAKWLGPYTIVATLGKGLYSLQSVSDPSNTTKRIYGAHLKPYNPALPSLKSDVSSGSSPRNHVHPLTPPVSQQFHLQSNLIYP